MTLEGNIFVKQRLSPRDLLSAWPPCRKLIVHYDTVLIRRYHLPGYQDDPLFSLFSEAVTLVILNICPSLSVLKARLAERQQRNAMAKSRFARLWKRMGQTPLRKIGGKRHVLETADFYEGVDIDQVYRQWKEFTATFRRPSRCVSILEVETRDGIFALAPS